MRYLNIIFFIILIGCSKNTRDIIVEGKVIDLQTAQPIMNAKITVLCWYDAGWDKTDYESIDLKTNKNGLFRVEFEEGYKIIIAGIAPKYNYKIIETKLDKPHVYFNIPLQIDSSHNNKNIEVDLKNLILDKTNNMELD